ncbi:hypothetical protein [Mesorhizobium humile]|uniref:hypothetical protein n=1 Tax=Mesorhizobium humile TaxID=3072313 RepID=UPI002A2B1597|nr:MULTISPECIES: hypothetical protein [unclassified Mesorhizobium]MDX8459794.1 hypothetical protein [Mesorhizobium sp. VK2D]
MNLDVPRGLLLENLGGKILESQSGFFCRHRGALAGRLRAASNGTIFRARSQHRPKQKKASLPPTTDVFNLRLNYRALVVKVFFDGAY